MTDLEIRNFVAKVFDQILRAFIRRTFYESNNHERYFREFPNEVRQDFVAAGTGMIKGLLEEFPDISERQIRENFRIATDLAVNEILREWFNEVVEAN